MNDRFGKRRVDQGTVDATWKIPLVLPSGAIVHLDAIAFVHKAQDGSGRLYLRGSVTDAMYLAPADYRKLVEVLSPPNLPPFEKE